MAAPPEWTSLLLARGGGIAVLIGLLLGWRRLRGTTLIAAWFWACLAATGLAATRWTELDANSPGAYAAAVLTLSPIIAVLGAKRPQHHAWQFVVLTLQVILAMPAAESLLFGHGHMPELHGSRQGVLCVLVLLGWTNYLPTRFFYAATLCAIGQLLLLSPFIDWLPFVPQNNANVWGHASIAAAVAVVWLTVGIHRSTAYSASDCWLAFRNAYGMAWSFRLAERFNATAQANQWPIELGWSGFHRRGTTEMAEIDADAVQCFDSLLRRFASRDWIDERREAANEIAAAE